MSVERGELARRYLAARAIAEAARDREALPAAGGRPPDSSAQASGLVDQTFEAGALRGGSHVGPVGDRTPAFVGERTQLRKRVRDARASPVGAEQLGQIRLDRRFEGRGRADGLVWFGSRRAFVISRAAELSHHYGPPGF